MVNVHFHNTHYRHNLRLSLHNNSSTISRWSPTDSELEQKALSFWISLTSSNAYCPPPKEHWTSRQDSPIFFQQSAWNSSFHHRCCVLVWSGLGPKNRLKTLVQDKFPQKSYWEWIMKRGFRVKILISTVESKLFTELDNLTSCHHHVYLKINYNMYKAE